MAHAPKPRYSLAYLHFLAKKRKLAQDRAVAGEKSTMDVDMDRDDERRRRTPVKSMTERTNELLVEYGFQ